MKRKLLIILIFIIIIFALPASTLALFNLTNLLEQPKEVVLSELNYSLKNRHDDAFVNEVFVDNILLTLNYLSGEIKVGEKFSWQEVKKYDSSQLILKPGETFAFHDTVDEKYKDKVKITTKAHFNSREGFKSDGYLVGDGVCHLASFLEVAAQKAGLMVEAPTNHNFAKINDVAWEDGVSIFYSPGNALSSAQQNLYVTNTKGKTIAFVFTHKDQGLNIKVKEF